VKVTYRHGSLDCGIPSFSILPEFCLHTYCSIDKHSSIGLDSLQASVY